MSTDPWYKWRVYCTTESAYITSYGPDEPTTCATDPISHSIDASKTASTEERSSSVVTINEGVGALGGFYRTKGEKMVIPTSHVVAGDITSAVSISDTVINVDQATIDAVELDYYVQINDGGTPGVLGKIVVIDDTNNQITVMGSGSPAAFSTGSIEILTTVVDYVQKKDIGVLSFGYVSSSDNDGDGLEVQVYPNLVIGGITADVSASDTVINVQQSVIDNIKVGFYFRLTDGVVTECFGEVLEIDDVNNQITVTKPAINGFLASSPTYVMMTVQMLKYDDIGPAGPVMEGEDKIGSSLILKNKAVRVCYTNYTGGAKKFCFRVGHIY